MNNDTYHVLYFETWNEYTLKLLYNPNKLIKLKTLVDGTPDHTTPSYQQHAILYTTLHQKRNKRKKKQIYALNKYNNF